MSTNFLNTLYMFLIIVTWLRCACFLLEQDTAQVLDEVQCSCFPFCFRSFHSWKSLINLLLCYHNQFLRLKLSNIDYALQFSWKLPFRVSPVKTTAVIQILLWKCTGGNALDSHASYDIGHQTKFVLGLAVLENYVLPMGWDNSHETLNVTLIVNTSLTPRNEKSRMTFDVDRHTTFVVKNL